MRNWSMQALSMQISPTQFARGSWLKNAKYFPATQSLIFRLCW
jgi:hypothetical protein